MTIREKGDFLGPAWSLQGLEDGAVSRGEKREKSSGAEESERGINLFLKIRNRLGNMTLRHGLARSVYFSRRSGAPRHLCIQAWILLVRFEGC